MIIDTDNLLSASGFARRHKISKPRAHKLIKQGRVPTITIDTKVFVDMSKSKYKKTVFWGGVERIGYFKPVKRERQPYEQMHKDRRTCIA